MDEVERLIAKLDLRPLPHEGGFFRQTWLGARNEADGRPAASSILYLITREGFSALHRLASDEIWHFHAGDPVRLVMLDDHTRPMQVVRLGAAIEAGDQPQVVVSKGIWQGARLDPDGGPGRGWALLGCTMTPGWDERDFELGVREVLRVQFPEAAGEIDLLTR